MSYTPQTPEEQAYIADLNAHDKAIWDYHTSHKVPLEDAYQAVTGKPWMAGRSIKFVGGTSGNTGNGFDMTKDRTVKSVLGKYVAPIGLGALTALTAGGALPGFAGLFGGGGAAAGGGVAGGGLGTGALAAGATIPGAGMVSGVGGTSLAGSIFGGIGKAALGKAAGDGTSNVTNGFSKALSGYAQSDASNRGAKTAAILDQNKQFEEELLARERNKRIASTDAYANAMQAQNAMNWQPAQRPAGVPGSMPAAMPSQQARDAAGTLYAQALAKLKAGDTLPPLVKPDLPLDPGTGEKIAGWGSLFAGLFGR